MERFLTQLERALWSWPLLVWILGTGLYMMLRLRFLPLRRLGPAMKLVFRSGEKGAKVSAFGALCTALSATIGTGNLVGVASALAIGGPGALLWMEISAVTGMALKYAEGYLAVKYRKQDSSGHPFGGPFAYISLGLGPGWRWLGCCFAVFGAAAGICGVGTFVQMGSITSGLRYYLEESFSGICRVRLFGQEYPVLVAAVGLILTGLAVPLLFGGIHRISRLSAALVPVMGGLYLLCCLWILAGRIRVLPQVFRDVITGAFTPAGAAGGLFGAIQAGVSRGVFSNEAGIGTAPIAAASAEGVCPAEQGLISMTATVFDTILICTMTGLVILSTGAGRNGAGIWSAMEAFSVGLPVPETVSRGIVVLCLCLFAFTTVVGWSFYGVQCLNWLTGGSKALRNAYLSIYSLTILAAPYFPVQALWSAANLCNGLMAIPNLLAILLLSPQIVIDSRAFFGYSKGRGGSFHAVSLSGRPGDRLYQALRRTVHR